MSEQVQCTEQEAIASYSRADIVSFGNYLLSEERKARTSEVNQGNVTHADVENWLAKQTVEETEDGEAV